MVTSSIVDSNREPTVKLAEVSTIPTESREYNFDQPSLKSRVWTKVKDNISIVAFSVASFFATLLTFYGSLVLFNDDTFFPLNLGDGIVRNWYTWSGGPSNSPNLSLVESPLYIIEASTGSLVFTQAVFLFALFVASGAGIMVLCRVMFQSRSQIPEFLAGFLYTFNFYTISYVWDSFKLWSLFYSTLPIVAVLFILALRASSKSRSVALLATAAFLAGLGGPFPSPILVFTLILVVVALSDKIRWARSLPTLGLFILIYALVNAYEFVPTIIALSGTLAQHAAQEPTSLFYSYPLAENPLNNIRLLGYEFIWYWGWGVPNYVWADQVTGNVIFYLASYCPFLIAIYAFFGRPLGTMRIRIAALFLLITGVIVGSAGSTPMGPYIFAVFSTTGLAQIYEIPFESFALLIVLSYVILGYESMSNFFKRVHLNLPQHSCQALVRSVLAPLSPQGDSLHRTSELKRPGSLESRGHLSQEALLGICVVLLLITGVLLDSFPIWQGELVPGQLNRGSSQIPVPSGHILIPKQYKDFDVFARSLNHQYSILVLPPYSPAAHIWPPGNESATDPLIEYFVGGLTVVNLDTLGPSPVTSIVNYLVSTNATPTEFLAVLGHLSIRYILIEKDWLPLYYYEYNESPYEQYLTRLQVYSSSALLPIWNSSRLVAYEIIDPAPLPIVSVASYVYATNTDTESFESFLSYPINSNVGVVPISPSDSKWALPNVLTSLSLTTNHSALGTLKAGNYSIFLEAQDTYRNLTAKGVALRAKLGNNVVALNLTRLSTVPGAFSGGTSVGSVYLPVMSSEDASIFGNLTTSFLNTADVEKSVNSSSSSGWTFNNRTSSINATEGNLTVISGFPSSASIGFNFSIPTNPAQTSYAGIFLRNSSIPSDSIGLIIRQGVGNTSGGLLLVTGDRITTNGAYANLPLYSAKSYSVKMVVRAGEIQVSLNGAPIEFLRGGSAVTLNNDTSIPVVDAYDAVNLQTNGLPLQIGNVSGFYSQYHINSILFRENVPDSVDSSTYYDGVSVSPVVFKLHIQSSTVVHPIVILSGYFGSDWVVTQSTWPNPDYPLLGGNDIALESALEGLVNFGSIRWNAGTVYVVYGPQFEANVGTIISISTAAVGVVAFLFSVPQARFKLKPRIVWIKHANLGLQIHRRRPNRSPLRHLRNLSRRWRKQ